MIHVWIQKAVIILSQTKDQGCYFQVNSVMFTLYQLKNLLKYKNKQELVQGLILHLLWNEYQDYCTVPTKTTRQQLCWPMQANNNHKPTQPTLIIFVEIETSLAYVYHRLPIRLINSPTFWFCWSFNALWFTPREVFCRQMLQVDHLISNPYK